MSTVNVGDRVGVGAQISACLDCDICKEGNETYCKEQLGTWYLLYSMQTANFKTPMLPYTPTARSPTVATPPTFAPMSTSRSLSLRHWKAN